MNRITACSVVLLACWMAGCSSSRPKLIQREPTTQESLEVGGRAAEVQQALMVFVDRFIPALAESWDQIARDAKTPEARLTARGRKIGGALAAMKNAVHPNPYAGLLDMVVMVTLLSDSANSAAAREQLGPGGQPLGERLASLQTEIWAIAAEFVTEAQLQELRASIKSWQEAHPDLQYLAFVRIDQFPGTSNLQDSKSHKRPNSVFGLLFLDPLSNLDPAVREFERSRQLAERAFFYLQRMPPVISWQAELAYMQMLDAPELQRTASGVETVGKGATKFAASANRLADTVEKFRAEIPQLRKDALDQVEGAVGRQRDAAIAQATTQISAERDAAIRQLTASVRTEQGEITANLESVLDRTIRRVYWGAGLLVCCILLAAIAYRYFAYRMRVLAERNDRLRAQPLQN